MDVIAKTDFESEVYFSNRNLQRRYDAGRSTILSWVANGQLPSPVRVGSSDRWLKSEVEACEKKAKLERDKRDRGLK